MKEYKCPFAVRRGTEIHCKIAKDCCGNVRYCGMAGRWVLTENALKCPLRKENENGQK
ncbi:MAG: hypothetical protein Q4G10_08295 [Bacteroidia bacterium]|nr:hypothetical protein [Bacteroidia bacterium]